MTKNQISILAHRAAAAQVETVAKNVMPIDGMSDEELERYQKGLRKIASDLWRRAYLLERSCAK